MSLPVVVRVGIRVVVISFRFSQLKFDRRNGRDEQIRSTFGAAQLVTTFDVELVDVDVGIAFATDRHKNHP